MSTPKMTVGADIIEINRFRRKPLGANKSFYNSIFTRSELRYCSKYSDPYPHLAGIFAAKEAVIKCSDQPLRMIDIKIVREGKRPVAFAYFDDNKKAVRVNISISHSRSIAMAIAVSNI